MPNVIVGKLNLNLPSQKKLQNFCEQLEGKDLVLLNNARIQSQSPSFYRCILVWQMQALASIHCLLNDISAASLQAN